MNGIGGNIRATIQTYTVTKNSIGEGVKQWANVQTITGWLDMMGGTSAYTNYTAKVQESTHVFVADYIPLASGIKAETSRMLINGDVYDITMIDNPMGMNKQLEIYLKYTGGI